jgi:hypothetical protein
MVSGLVETAAATPAAVVFGLAASPVEMAATAAATPGVVGPGLVASSAERDEMAAMAGVAETVVATPAAVVETVVNTGRTAASCEVVQLPVVKLSGASALHRLPRQPCLSGISRSRWRFPMTQRPIYVIGRLDLQRCLCQS